MSDFDVNALRQWREERDEFCRNHYASPIPEDHLPAFPGLRYFDADPTLALWGPFSAEEGTIEISSSTGGSMKYRLAGRIALDFGAVSHELLVLHGEAGEMFIPFRDATSGTDSYVGGRYAPAVLSGGDEATVDFNRAINPYCAYDEEFSCPMAPEENWLAIPVRAGEMSYVAPS